MGGYQYGNIFISIISYMSGGTVCIYFLLNGFTLDGSRRPKEEERSRKRKYGGVIPPLRKEEYLWQ